jgi:hypothetical protein
LISHLKVEQRFSGNDCILQSANWLTYPWRDACQRGRGEQWI